MSIAAVTIGIGGTAVVVGGVLVAVCAVLWISALASVLRGDDDFERGSQLVWLLAVLLAGPVGAVLYFLLARQPRMEDLEPVPDRRHRSEAIADPWSEPAPRRPVDF